MRLFVLLPVLMIALSTSLTAQLTKQTKDIRDGMPTTKEAYEAQYKRNIAKSRINGVYIPTDADDALVQIKKLATAEALEKFSSGPEEIVVKKLKLGIGRWIVLNWSFYEGSRLSHSLKELGLLHPEDMSSYLLTILHRQLNQKDIQSKALIEDLATKRKAEAYKALEGLDVIETKTIQHEKK